MPARREAKDVYDALEQARVEMVGSRHMAGVAANLRAKLTEECEAEGYDRMTRKDQLPVAAALALAGARADVGRNVAAGGAGACWIMWRDTLGRGRPTRRWSEIGRTQDDQMAFTRAARKLLAALDLAEAESRRRPGGSDRGRRGQAASSPASRTISTEGQGQSESDTESMLGAQPEEMEGEAADDEGD